MIFLYIYLPGGGIKGIEAEYHWNIVNAFSELAADHLMGQMEGLGDFQRIDLNEQQGVKIKKGKKLNKKSSKAHDELWNKLSFYISHYWMFNSLASGRI